MTGAALIAAITLFTSWSFTDLWLGDRGGLKWFWSKKKPGALHTTSRIAILLALLCALSMAVADNDFWFCDRHNCVFRVAHDHPPHHFGAMAELKR